jgi:hypothetical protein
MEVRYFEPGTPAEEVEGPEGSPLEGFTAPYAWGFDADDERIGARVAVVTGLMEGEPVFFLRARDALALPVVMQYLDSYARLFAADRVTQLEEDVDEWIAWRREHAADVRDPD